MKQGSGIHSIDLARLEIKDNTIYCLTPGQVHHLNASKETDGLVMSFTQDFLSLSNENHELLYNSGLFYCFLKASAIEVTFDIREELKTVAQKMQKKFENFFLLRAEILRSCLKIFLIYLTRQFERIKKDQHHYRNVGFIRNFLILLEKIISQKNGF